MITVTLVLPKDQTELRKAYGRVLGEIVSEMLSHDELGYLLSEIDKKEKQKINEPSAEGSLMRE